MFFLLRVAFWLSIVLVLLPSGTTSKAPQAQSAVGAVETLTAAGAAVSDMTQFCDRQPDACEVGAQAAVAFGQRAQAGARMVLDFINEKVVKNETGSIKPTPVSLAGKPSQHTLRTSDMQPAWRAPIARPQTRNAS